MSKIKQTLKNNNGGVHIYVGFALFLLFMICIMFSVYTYSLVQSSENNIKETIKVELNNLTTNEAKNLFEDMSEQNYDAYIDYFNSNKAEIRTDFLKTLKKTLPIETDSYSINENSIELNFEIADNSIIYHLKYNIEIYITILNHPFSLPINGVNITAAHNFKIIEESSEDQTIINKPNQKEEHLLN